MTCSEPSLIAYQRLFLFLSKHLVMGKRDKEILQELHDAGIQTPSGRTYTHDALRQLLKSLRNPATYPSRASAALHQLHQLGRLKMVQCLPLTHRRFGALTGYDPMAA